jgi:hypothetical protein
MPFQGKSYTCSRKKHVPVRRKSRRADNWKGGRKEGRKDFFSRVLLVLHSSNFPPCSKSHYAVFTVNAP